MYYLNIKSEKYFWLLETVDKYVVLKKLSNFIFIYTDTYHDWNMQKLLLGGKDIKICKLYVFYFIYK